MLRSFLTPFCLFILCAAPSHKMRAHVTREGVICAHLAIPYRVTISYPDYCSCFRRVLDPSFALLSLILMNVLGFSSNTENKQ